MYHEITIEDIKNIENLVGISHVLHGTSISPDYAKDELGNVRMTPELVVMAHTKQEISAVLNYANSHLIPVTTRGSGTGLVGGAVAIEKGIVLDTTKMNHILELDEANLTLTVEPGVLLMDINDYLESKGYFYAPDPGEKSATIGGNIATNAGGMKAVKYGVTRDWVRSVEICLANGKIEQFGRKVVKDSSGYSLKNLIIGSEGTLGVITEAILKLIPKPKYFISLLVPFASMEKGIEAVPKIIQSNVAPIAIEFFERKTLLFAEDFLGKKFPDTSSDAYILLSFDGQTETQIKETYHEAALLCLNVLGASDVLIVDTEERKDAVWKTRGAFLEAIKASTTEMDECDVVVPRSEVANFIKYTYELSEKIGIRLPSFGHAGDGNLHIYLCKDAMDDETFSTKKHQVFDLMYEKARLSGGLVSGEHGIGYAKKAYLQKQLGETQMDLMREIKHAFDPFNILNPHKIID
jgi:glycolate oxidase